MAMPTMPARGELGKLGILLACLVATLALLIVRGPSASFGGAEVRGQGPGCWARLPSAMRISPEGLGRLHARIAGLVPPTVGRTYEQGYVSSSALFSDDEPLNPGSNRRHGPVG